MGDATNEASCGRRLTETRAPASYGRVLLVLLLLACSGSCGPSRAQGLATPTQAPGPSAPSFASVSSPSDIEWLLDHSMLEQAARAARRLSGTGQMWRYPYATPRPRAASSLASVWFTAYPAATITREGGSVLTALGDPALWSAFRAVGITAMHTGPMKRAGGVRNRSYTPTVDGNFDRISTEIDPAFGTEDAYRAMVMNARANGAVIIGDIIPGHSGKGADFRLAERAYRDYPGLYHMVAIEEKDWSLLPPVPSGRDSVNLGAESVEALHARGYIVGRLPRTIFYEKGIKETDWSATDIIAGADGKRRRWVYLHYFKEGQPSFNWLDPSFAAQRLLMGDAAHSLGTLGEKMLRLDANGFLGIEAGRPGSPAWSEGHPLSVTSNQLLAGMVRKLGGFTFQELNLTLEDIKAMSPGGADLTYDFITRPAYQHALLTGDTAFLRLMLALQRRYGIDPAGLIHALQNHDELTLELVHFWTTHKDDRFTFRDKEMKGSELRDLIRGEVHTRLLAPAAPYNLKAANGVSCTSASIAAAALGIRDLDRLSEEQKLRIRRAHLLLAMYNAMQPGVFALSGWDLVGALPVSGSSVRTLLADGDTRWINRGAYDLLGANPRAQRSAAGLPRAISLYGSLPQQLQTPDSFAAQLRKLLRIRAEYRLNEAEQLDVPRARAPGLLILLHRLPADRGLEITALNFGGSAVEESVSIAAGTPGAAVLDLLADRPAGRLSAERRLSLVLGPHEGAILLIPNRSQNTQR
jgi:trehalose synthase